MTGESPSPVTNFGRNIRLTPGSLYRPRSEAEVLRILEAGLASFRQVRDDFDPGGVFRNAFLKEHIPTGDER